MNHNTDALSYMRTEEKILFANTGGVFRRRSNELRNPSANGMQSNPFAESDLALVNRNRGKSAPNNAAPRDRRRRNWRTNRWFSGDSQVSHLFHSFSLEQIVTSASENKEANKERTDNVIPKPQQICDWGFVLWFFRILSFRESRRFTLITILNIRRHEIHPFLISFLISFISAYCTKKKINCKNLCVS